MSRKHVEGAPLGKTPKADHAIEPRRDQFALVRSQNERFHAISMSA